jgi:hypothetical protein
MRKLILSMFCLVVVAVMFPVCLIAEEDQTASGTSDIGSGTEYKEGDKITPENLDSYQKNYRDNYAPQDNGTPGGKEG